MADGPYNVNAGATLTVPAGAGPPPDLLNNDTLGVPTGAIASFGGGSAGGSVTSNLAGAPLSLGSGGSLQVNANGSFLFKSSTGFTGAFTFQYRLTNSEGSSDATVTINVSGPPNAVNDPTGDIPSNSTPPSGANPNVYHVALNTTLSPGAGAGPPPGLLVNDSLGFPSATITSFGGLSAGGSVTSNLAGSTLSLGSGGSLRVNADGSFTFTPATNFTGVFNFQYRLTNTGGTSDGTVTIAVGFRPAASTDAVTVTGNVKLDSSTMTTPLSVLTNDTGDQLTLALTSPTSTNGGDVTMTTSGVGAGRFTFDPKVGSTAADSFGYSISNGFGSVNGTVNVTVSNILWFVDNTSTCSASCDGRFTHPFTTLASFGTANGTANGPAVNETIFVYESATAYTGPATLLSGQKLLGQDASSSLETIAGFTVANGSATIPSMNSANGTRTTITSSGNGVVLNNTSGSNTLRGMTLGNATTDALNGSSFGTLTLANGTTEAADVTINTTGRAVNLATGSVNGALVSTTSSGGATNVTLSTIGGTFNLGSGALSGSTTGASNHAFAVSGGAGAITYSGTISKTTQGDVVNVASKSGGSLTLSGDLTCNTSCTGVDISSNSGGTTTLSGSTKTINTGANVAVNLTGNTGATINFTGGGLDIDTTSATGFNATGGGTVNVTTGTNANTINSTTGTALNVANTTIGSSGLTFRSISSNGATNGIVLNSTGSSGGLSVTGNGGACTSTTPTCTGGTIAASTDTGIKLTSTSNVSLTRMRVNTSTNFGVNGNTVSGMTIDSSLLDGTHGGAVDEGALFVTNWHTNGTISNTEIRGGFNDNVRINNTTGTLNRLTVSNSNIHNSGNNHGFAFYTCLGDGPSSCSGVTMNLTVSNSTFNNNSSNHIDLGAKGLASMDVNISGNTFTTDNVVGNNPFGGAFNASIDHSSHMTFDVGNNTSNHSKLTAFNFFVSNQTSSTSSMVGRFHDNTIGTNGVGSSASIQGGGLTVTATGSATLTMNITNNTIRNWNSNNGIDLLAGDGGVTGPVVNWTVTGNTLNLSNPTANNLHGISSRAGTTSTGGAVDACVDIGGTANNVVGSSLSSAGGTEIRVRQINFATVQLPGYGGAALDTTAVVNYLAARNTTSGAGSLSATVQNNIGFTGGAACTQAP
ncbi:MAG: cadherin-like domain-containing protein [Chloroflexota bacterium]